MSNHAVDATRPSGERSGAVGNLAANSPYILVLLLALFGVAYTSLARCYSSPRRAPRWWRSQHSAIERRQDRIDGKI